MINSYELTAIFPFLHNGRQFPFDVRRSADPNFGGGVSNLEFFCMINSYELTAIFPFLHNGRQFPSTSEEAQTQTLGELVIWSFSV